MTLSTPPGFVKVWPSLLLATKKRRPLYGGAVRAYFLGRSLDPGGSGGVDSDVLKAETLTLLGEKRRRTAQRWLKQAQETCLLRLSSGRYWYLSLGKAASVLGVAQIGKPAYVHPEQQVKPGWRSVAWAGQLTAHQERPCSRRVLKKLSGVSARSQSRHERQNVGHVRNYCDRGPGTQSDAEAWREQFNLTLFESRGRLIQRLSDLRTVNSNTAQPAKRGRSRKAQQDRNSCFLAREQTNPSYRLFHSDPKRAEATARRPGIDEDFLFIRQDARSHSNRWRCVISGAYLLGGSYACA